RGGTYNVTDPVPYNAQPLTDSTLTLYSKGQYGAGTFSVRAVNILGQQGFISDQISPDNNQYTNGTQPLNAFKARGLPPVGVPLANELSSRRIVNVGLALFPNPGKSIIVIKSRSEKPIQVFDARGRLVASLNQTNNSTGEIVWNTQALPVGMYSVRAIADGKVFSKKLVIMR
ncbi:MAG: T9SS type A sorting domain-containing protein, partial [Fibrobacteres bacterium]|nr:T9SS type A sorting domain-containing protein [Fibrobacterota bacterium]